MQLGAAFMACDFLNRVIEDCGSAWKRDPVSGVIGVE
jgi:hypothetical protein